MYWGRVMQNGFVLPESVNFNLLFVELWFACRPTIQFSDDETVSCRLVTNEVHFFDPQDFSKGIVDKLRLPGIQVAQLATSPATHVAAYVPEMKVSLSFVFLTWMLDTCSYFSGCCFSRHFVFRGSITVSWWHHIWISQAAWHILEHMAILFHISIIRCSYSMMEKWGRLQL